MYRSLRSLLSSWFPFSRSKKACRYNKPKAHHNPDTLATTNKQSSSSRKINAVKGGERRWVGAMLTWATESSNSEGSRPFSFWIFFLAVYILPSLRRRTLRPRRRFDKQSTDQQPAQGEMITIEREGRSMVESVEGRWIPELEERVRKTKWRRRR